ncbi:response regulator transcription factor [Opitutus sp. GAS368]|uniref:response regulator n=1 Tax=Opitutus sp. GAS368 TaxID=1882749 RepID=UPI00087B47C9|nr:response regulator transcription factor [Opitutus sp. GAS368]SDR67798.1 two component transcriptional regulator, LuxR family [Opitutus sp. GAS368]
MTKEPAVRILVVDDHFIVRMGLIALINTEPDLAVIGETDDGDQAIALFEKLKPDLVLMDLRMPRRSGTEATRHIRQMAPAARVLMLSAFDGDADIHAALEAGAHGYVLKSATGEDLIPAIRAVAAGKRWIPREVATRLKSRNAYEELTAREIDVLNQLARGLANKEIADELKISEYTTKDHLKSILAKLRVADRTQAVTAALSRGIIRL